MHTRTTTAKFSRTLAVLITLAIAMGLTAALPSPARAADAKNFDPGYLISDQDFFNGTALTAAAVDSFIGSQNKGCVTGRVCLKNYKESIKAKAKTTRCDAIAAASNRTAGQIIAAVGKACGISPKAILVILQKEQSLVTAQSPGARAFEAAMGAGCPDTAPCDGKYAGFYEQVYYGASLLKGYTIPGSTHYNRYPAGKTSSIAYHPNSLKTPAKCGFKDVAVRNQATHALYVYTPYTPNAAALKNLTGTGDSCSAYGNRNFWRLYTDWFGPSGSVGPFAIDEYYSKQGGASGWLGAKVGAIVTTKTNGGGMVQRFAGGVVTWTAATGARPITQGILAFWDSQGGVEGILGWPTASPVKMTANGGGTSQVFTNGVVSDSPAGTFKLIGSYANVWAGTGGGEGPLGFATTKVVTSSGKPSKQTFQGGVIYYKSGKTTTWVPNELAAEVTKAQGMGGTYGWTKSLPTRDASGRWTLRFDKATMTWTEETQGITVPTYLETAWRGYKGPSAPLGMPVANRTWDAKSGVNAQRFEGGTVYVKGSKTKAWVPTIFMETYSRAGAVTGKYGWPTGVAVNDTRAGGGQVQSYAKASFASTNGTDVYVVHGLANTAWKKFKTIGGPGWPVGNRYAEPISKVSAQDFTRGTIYVQGSKQGWIAPELNEFYAKQKGPVGPYGWPKANPVRSSVNGGGVRQDFANRSLTWTKDAGTRSILTNMHKAWVGYGGHTGKLGWATTQRFTDPLSGVPAQSFVGGTIYIDGSRTTWVPTVLTDTVNEMGGVKGSTLGWPQALPSVTASKVTQKFAKGTLTWTASTGEVAFSK